MGSHSLGWRGGGGEEGDESLVHLTLVVRVSLHNRNNNKSFVYIQYTTRISWNLFSRHTMTQQISIKIAGDIILQTDVIGGGTDSEELVKKILSQFLSFF